MKGVIELGSFHEFTSVQLAFLEQLMLSVGLAINLIGTSMRTEQLLQQLQGSNAELDRRRKELEERADQLESRKREILQAGASLEAKSQESQYKSQFLTNMSHEIRTPLNSMMILAQMLAANEDRNLSDTQQDMAATIHSAGQDLLALINQILDLSKIEAGRIETHFEPYPVLAIQEFAERTFRPVAMQQGLEFSIEVAHDVPATLTTDRQLLDQILKNLLANAFKFTERGRVKLHIERVAPGLTFRAASLLRAEAVIAFSVSDTGIGIASAHFERIFEAFQQADTSITRKAGGTGLGLTISREYARILGGDVAVQSTLNGGSTFTLYLPFRSDALDGLPVPQAGRAAEAPPVPPMPITAQDTRVLAGKTILVVEDDARNLYSVTSLLERFKVRVIAANGAREAYARLREHPDTDLVLMDIMMPEIDGYEATREIREMKDFATLPIIALTAKAGDFSRTQCLAAGCTDYVVKPVDLRQLTAVIVQHLRAN